MSVWLCLFGVNTYHRATGRTGERQRSGCPGNADRRYKEGAIP